MRAFSYVLAALLCVAATVGVELLCGRHGSRLAGERQLAEAAAKIDRIPRQFGHWKATEDASLSRYALDVLQCSGYVNRRYVHQTTGEAVWVIVLAGPRGPLVAHRPEICLSSREYEMTGDARQIDVGDAGGQLNCVTFKERGVAASTLTVYYGWSRPTSAACFEAPQNSRGAFVGEPVLYKLQVSIPGASTLRRKGKQENRGESFLREFVPHVRAALL